MKRIDLVYAYYLNEFSRLQADLQQLQVNLRYRNIDAVDCMEFMLAQERLNTYKQVMKNIFLLLNIKEDSYVYDFTEDERREVQNLISRLNYYRRKGNK